MLNISHIQKQFGTTHVLEDISCTAAPGDLVLVLGANGSGKSTLLRICAGLTRAGGGTITWDGRPLNSREIGYAAHRLHLYAQLTAKENVDLWCSLTNYEGPSASLLTEWELGPVANRRIAELSQGTAARVSLARVFAKQRLVLFLDEPTSNLDRFAVDCLIQKIADQRAAGATVVVATHDLARLNLVPTQVIVLAGGRVGFSSTEGTPSALDEAVQFYRESNR